MEYIAEKASLVVQGVFIPMVGSFGLAGNLLALKLLRSKNLGIKATFRAVLTLLSIFDSIFILSFGLAFSMPLLSDYWKSRVHPHITPWIFPLIQISLNGSTWTTVSLTIERFISVLYPFTRLNRSSAVYTIPVIVIAMVWNIPRFGELNTCYEEADNTQNWRREDNATDIPEANREVDMVARLCPTSLRTDVMYEFGFILVANFIVMVAFPACLLAYFNIRLFQAIKKSGANLGLTSHEVIFRQRRDKKLARLLISLVILFGVCNIPRVVVNGIEFFLRITHGKNFPWPLWCNVLTIVSHLLLNINSSANIIIYCWKDGRFRRCLLSMICKSRYGRGGFSHRTTTTQRTETENLSRNML